MNDIHAFAEDLGQDLCRSFAVRELGGQRWVVRTPFLYDDGDAVPIIVEFDGSSWSLTDDGMTISHLFFDSFEPTERRLKRLKDLAMSSGVEMTTEHRLCLHLDHVPTAYDIGDFLQLLAAIRGVAVASGGEREQVRYITSVRNALTPHLANAGWELNWPIPGGGTVRATYRVDMRIPTQRQDQPVALFVASTAEKTNFAALAVVHLRRSESRARPVLAFNPERVHSEAVYRFQDEAMDDSAAVEVQPARMRQLLHSLSDRGVELIDAS